MVVALALTRNRARARDLVQDAFERLMTTRPWDPAKGTLADHLAGIVRSLANIAYHAAAPEAEAQEVFYDETGRSARSAEKTTLDHAEAAERDARGRPRRGISEASARMGARSSHIAA